MIGPILLAISWVLLRLERRGLGAIGVDQPRRRLGEFAVGFIALGAAAALQQFGLALATGNRFTPNATLELAALVRGARFVINSVLFEELVFRGYLLYQAIRWLGPRRAVWLSAGAFGVYHWFSYGVLGQPVVMVYVLVLTGAYGLMWARAFAATGSVAAPIGLHLGWNAVAYLVFSAGPTGAGLLVPTRGPGPIAATGWASLVLNLLFPLALTAFMLWHYAGYARRGHDAGKALTSERPPTATVATGGAE
jgi:membrane protease YdiL (CAAX protease family)